jgi:hypothetical protein
MSQSISQQPEYTRLPKPGEREPHTKLSRSSVDRLVRPQPCNDFNPPVESKVVSIRGGKNAKRGARLVSLKSLLAYIGSQPEVELTSISGTKKAR